MKSKYLRYIFYGSLLLITGVIGCKKEVQVGAPVTQLVTTSVFNNNATATAATLSIYAQLVGSSYPFNIHRSTGLSSDELTNYAIGDLYSGDLYTNSLNANLDGGNGVWTPCYALIYQANAVLENLQASTQVNPKVKKQLSGEAYFMRAYFYFYLVNFYGDVPLVTSTDYKGNAALPRTSQSTVYAQIVSDLKQAQTFLNSNYVDASDTTVTLDHIRPTSWAATALLARVYLYMGAGHYADAETLASTVINNTQLQLPADLTKVFLKNSSEAIWQITPSSTAKYTDDGNYFILNAVPGPAASQYSSTISPQLLNAFETGDQRKINWIGSYSSGGTTWYYPYKYRDGQTATSVTEYTTILRLAEQYLIRAEARAQQGNTSGALADLNVIRNRAGLANYTGATDQASLLTAIAHERQVELFTEGDRWFDLKRTKTVDAVMGTPGGVCAAKGGFWDTRQQLYPIPPSDIQGNPNLVQNPGY